MPDLTRVHYRYCLSLEGWKKEISSSDGENTYTVSYGRLYGAEEEPMPRLGLSEPFNTHISITPHGQRVIVEIPPGSGNHYPNGLNNQRLFAIPLK